MQKQYIYWAHPWRHFAQNKSTYIYKKDKDGIVTASNSYLPPFKLQTVFQTVHTEVPKHYTLGDDRRVNGCGS